MIYICDKCGMIKDSDYETPDDVNGEVLCEDCLTDIEQFINEGK